MDGHPRHAYQKRPRGDSRLRRVAHHSADGFSQARSETLPEFLEVLWASRYTDAQLSELVVRILPRTSSRGIHGVGRQPREWPERVLARCWCAWPEPSGSDR